MSRRIKAWLAIAALLASAIPPAHAVTRVAPRSPGADFCTTTPAKSVPAPARVHDTTCNACCGCGLGTAALPVAPTAAAPAPVTMRGVRALAVAAKGAGPAAALARGPPVRAASPA